MKYDETKFSGKNKGLAKQLNRLGRISPKIDPLIDEKIRWNCYEAQMIDYLETFREKK